MLVVRRWVLCVESEAEDFLKGAGPCSGIAVRRHPGNQDVKVYISCIFDATASESAEAVAHGAVCVCDDSVVLYVGRHPHRNRPACL